MNCQTLTVRSLCSGAIVLSLRSEPLEQLSLFDIIQPEAAPTLPQALRESRGNVFCAEHETHHRTKRWRAGNSHNEESGN